MEKQKEEEKKQREQYTTMLSLMNELMMHTGDNTAHDYDGVNNWDDVILYLNSHMRSLPSKRIEDNYTIGRLKEGSLESQISLMIEDDLMGAVKEKDLRKLMGIKKAIQGAITMCDEYQEDLMIKLYEVRAKVLSKILDFVTGLQFVKQGDDGAIKLGTIEPWDDGILEKLIEVLRLELPGIELDFILTEMRVSASDDHVIIWDWVE